MSALSRRSAIAILLAVSIVVGTLVVGGAAGQTDTQPEPTETATPVETATPTETVTDEPPTETETETETEPETEDEAYDQDTSFLRVAHVSPDAPPVDVYVDGERVLADAPFGSVSDYLTLPAGDYEVRITPAGESENETVFEGNLTLDPRAAMTLFAAGEVGENATEPFVPILFEDDPFRPTEDEAAVSVAHMSPDAPAVDVTANDGSVVLAENVSFQEASQYATVPAGDHVVEIRPATETNDGPVVATANVSLSGGTAYSAIAVGYVNANESTTGDNASTAGDDASTDGEALRVEVVEDASKTVHLPSSDGDGTATNETDDGTPADGTPTQETPGEEPTPTNETEGTTATVTG